MWFKNLVLYRLDTDFELTPEELEERIAAGAFKPCGGLEPFSLGWSPPLGRGTRALVHAPSGHLLVCARREERLLPPAVVRETLDERIAAIEDQEARPVRGRERRRMRDEVIFELMPKAFTRSRHTHAYLSPASGWMVVDAASPKRAEELVGLMARSVPGLGIEPYGTEHSVASELTAWLANRNLPDGFTLLDDCELRDPAESGSVVRCQRQDLTGPEIRAHLDAHKIVQRLALGFEERLSLVLAADLAVKRLRFEAVEELDDGDDLDELARFDANFAFMTAELARLLARLEEVFPPA